MFTLLIKYKNVVTDEKIEIIKQNKLIDHMYIRMPGNIDNPSYRMSPFTGTQL